MNLIRTAVVYLPGAIRRARSPRVSAKSKCPSSVEGKGIPSCAQKVFAVASSGRHAGRPRRP